jgi:hypothetical protein
VKSTLTAKETYIASKCSERSGAMNETRNQFTGSPLHLHELTYH